MKNNPDIHHRRSIRLRGYDYSRAGAYFVTICSQNHECLFGDLLSGDMHLNSIGKIVNDQWNAIPQRFSTVELDAFVVMPNHIHGIFTVGAPLAGARIAGGATRATARVAPTVGGRIADGATRATARVAPTLGDIVGAFKSLCVHHVLQWMKQHDPDRMMGKLWQRNYYEHIIRNESELNRIRDYIRNNPACWELDKLHPGMGDRPIALIEIRESSAEYATDAWMV